MFEKRSDTVEEAKLSRREMFGLAPAAVMTAATLSAAQIASAQSDHNAPNETMPGRARNLPAIALRRRGGVSSQAEKQGIDFR